MILQMQSAFLLGRKPQELKKKTELRMRLTCRGQRSEDEREIVKRVYIITGKYKNIVDTVPQKSYSRRKEQASTITDVGSEHGVSVEFPGEDGDFTRKCLVELK